MISTKTNQVHVFYEYNIVEMWKMPRNIIKCNAFCESTMHLTMKCKMTVEDFQVSMAKGTWYNWDYTRHLSYATMVNSSPS